MAKYDLYKVTELGDTQHSIAEWEVDVPQDSRDDPATYLMKRAKCTPTGMAPSHHMNSPTLRRGKNKPREVIENAVLHFLRTNAGTYLEKDKPRAVVVWGKTHDRVRNKQRARTLQPLYPVAFEQKSDGSFHLELISDCDEPNRYAVVIPRATADNIETYTCQLYRRTNPRSKDDPQYALLPMSRGRFKPKQGYTMERLVPLLAKVQELQKLVNPDSKEHGTLELLNSQLLRYDPRYVATLDLSEQTVQYRLKQQAKFVVDKLMVLTTAPSPDNVAVWKQLSEGIIKNRERLVPLFEAHMAKVKARKLMESDENKKLALHGAQSPADSRIPPFPYHLMDQHGNPTQRPTTPANAIPDVQPVHNPQTALDILGNLLNPT